MLKDITPWAFGGTCDGRRLVVQHMDGRKLNYPDDFFDGLFSSSSIEHFGGWPDVEQAARDWGRVLKPGGIMTLTTESPVPGNIGEGFDNVLILNAERVQRHIIAPSGCVLLEPICWDVSEVTQQTAQSLDKVAEAAKRGDPSAPHVVVTQHGHRFTSLSLVLRKPR
jgi:ubiquinone/menaquinone biosynthesis C-methylase UbiE